MRASQKWQLVIGILLTFLVVIVYQRIDYATADVYSSGGSAAGAVVSQEQKQAPQGVHMKLEELDSTDLMESEPSAKLRMEARKRHLQKACLGMKLDADVAEQRDLEITIAYGKLKLCGLEKTASTFFKDIRRKERPRPDEESPPFKSFIVVREPYSRLVSGYIDKMYSRAGWWGMYGKYMVENFRYMPSEQEKRCGSNVTFHEFVRYWAHAYATNKKQDGHFRPMHKTCRMCYFDYDYYVRLETIGADMTHIYESVNLTLDRPMTDDEVTLKDKAHDIMIQRDDGSWTGCETACSMLDRTWWTFHARGLVALDVRQPFTGEACNTVSPEEFMKAAMDAHVSSKDRIDKRKQRREMMVSLYLQLPLLDRLMVRDILMKDFKLHGYDPTPRDMFPELYF